MRFVIKSDADRTSRLASDDTYKKLLKIVKTGDKSLISDSIYRDSYNTADGVRSKVEDQLAIAYKNKCAYCERICKADIEHYRPKKGVLDDPTHPGYYWLCYEWSNLVPSCITCNREGAKHNHFPIIGVRVTTPTLLPDSNLDLASCKAYNTPLLDEVPFLLHPEVDRPEDFFTFKLDPRGEGIRIVGIDPSGRGQRTIEICLLNRKEIKLDRVERVVDEFKDAIHSLFAQHESGEITESQLADMIIQNIRLLKQRSLSDDKTHTYLRKHIVASSNNFKAILIPFLRKNVQNIVLEAYRAIEPL
jgi:uncharacterized protein (TIGR02646 family)